MLTDQDIEAIARRVVAIQAERTPSRDVLTLSEAIAFVGKASLKAPAKAFARWRQAHGVRPCAFGRYSLRSLKAGLEREQRKTYRRAA